MFENKPLNENWSAETKLTVVLKAAGLSMIDLSEYCCRKGLSLDEYGLATSLHHWPKIEKKPAK